MFQRKKKLPEEISNLSWEADIVLNERKSRIVAWRVAASALIVCLLMAASLVALIPLKQVVPYVVEVDKMTGESSVVSPVKDFVTTTAINDKHWIKSFIIARERYNFPLLQHDYDTVRTLSNGAVWSPYAKQFEGSDSLDKKYGEHVVITPTILSITLNEKGIATVRYELSNSRGSDPIATRRIATMRYSYKQVLSRRESEIIDNPLGFTVESYQTDPELSNSAADAKVAQ